MSQNRASNPEEEGQQPALPYSPQHDLLHEPLQEDIVLTRWRLQTILEAMEREKARVTIEDSFPWIGVLLAFLLALIPRDFQTFLGFSGDVWTAIALIGTAFSAFKILQVWWWVFKHRDDPKKTSAKLVQEIVDEIKASREKYLQKAPPPQNLDDQTTE